MVNDTEKKIDFRIQIKRMYTFVFQKLYVLYCEGQKNCTKLFCSHFMSFYPIDFIFIGCIGYDMRFFWVPRNFGF